MKNIKSVKSSEWEEVMAWVNSREFAKNHNINVEGVLEAIKRADSKNKKFCTIKGKFLPFTYAQGVGRGGKVLKIWDEPFSSEEEALSFYEREVVGVMENDFRTTSTTITTSPKMRGSEVANSDIQSQIKPSIYDRSYLLALEKQSVLQDWERAKQSDVRAKDFIYAINAKGDYSFELSENKLFAWLRAYRNGGFEALRDTRGKNRSGENRIKDLGCEELVISLIKASKGGVNINSMHRALHILLHKEGKFDFEVFNSKKGEAVSYSVLRRYVLEWLKANPMSKKLIERGSDAVTGSFAPAVGEARRGKTLNEIVEIDGTSLDLIIDAREYAKVLGVSVEGEWQKRFTLIQLIDTYSKVRSFFICESENKLGVARAIAKYISKFGKPKVIRGDNGKAFTSKDVQACLENLGITYERTRAYSGWEKPFVEKGFGTLQNHLMEWMKGYIGHSVSQRQAIEFFFNRKERRLAKGHKTHLRDLHLLSELNVILDDYVEAVLLNSYDEALACSPLEAFNAESHKAEAIHEYELSAKLLPAMKRSVGKEGVSMDGYKWVHPLMFNYSSVYITQNINNLFQSFVFDPQMNFLGEAIIKDGNDPLIAEVAKSAKREHQKRLRAIKKGVEASRKEIEEGFLEGVKKIKQSAKKPNSPKLKPLNSTMQREVKLKEAKASGDLERYAQDQNKRSKKDLSWEACVLRNA
ncbi:DDE-type integrase/transposase/recombinase [uncultured Helicobacter sp.]|uniref:DDE-type integrase/transposase/recombinase n=1 Tax=uncultured Helicobacter sp. TaxID=175537 RepID=UPI002631D59D|nr:DDE-type integrase/transposase/recombinase [uncultured Helicobacter sp.]